MSEIKLYEEILNNDEVFIKNSYEQQNYVCFRKSIDDFKNDFQIFVSLRETELSYCFNLLSNEGESFYEWFKDDILETESLGRKKGNEFITFYVTPRNFSKIIDQLAYWIKKTVSCGA